MGVSFGLQLLPGLALQLGRDGASCIHQLDPALKALGFNRLKAHPLSSCWFQIDSTCTPLQPGLIMPPDFPGTFRSRFFTLVSTPVRPIIAQVQDGGGMTLGRERAAVQERQTCSL